MEILSCHSAPCCHVANLRGKLLGGKRPSSVRNGGVLCVMISSNGRDISPKLDHLHLANLTRNSASQPYKAFDRVQNADLRVFSGYNSHIVDKEGDLRNVVESGEPVTKVLIPGLPDESNGDPGASISSCFWEWKPKFNVHYEKSGSKNVNSPPVLFLPGFGVGSFHYEKQLNDLGRDFRVWAIDFLGQGMSLPVEDPTQSKDAGSLAKGNSMWGFGDETQPWANELVYSIDLWQDQVQYFIKEVIKEPVYVVGNSLGGYVALYFAACNPDLVKGVTLLNATPFWGFLPNPMRSPKLARMFPWAGTFPDYAEAADPENRSPIFKQLNANDAKTALQLGFIEGEENRQKTKKEVMEEIISKSKFFKAQKAKDKEENEQLIDQLDENFTSLVQSEALLSLTQPNKMNALKALVNRSFSNDNAKKDVALTSQNYDTLQQDKPDSYDKLVQEMALDMRARPSNRTKTPEEIAEEEKERLERLEEERQKRMLAADDSSDEDRNALEDIENAGRLRSISGDDLGDSFSHDEEKRTKRGWIDEILQRDNVNAGGSEEGTSSEDSESSENDGDGEGSDEDDGEYEKTRTLKDWEQSDDDPDSDLEEGKDREDDYDESDEEMEPKGYKVLEIKEKQTSLLHATQTKTNNKLPSAQVEELPFVIAAPQSLEELSSLLENRSDCQIVEAIRRIRACNAISIAAENRKKLQVFYGVLLQYFAVSANKRPLNFKLLNLLVKPLMEMSGEIPYFAAICARERLLQTRRQFCEDIKNTEKSCWPSLKTLFLLRLWSMIFPCSDFRHVVMTPAILLMCEYLMRCPIKSARDVAIGSFLCSMVLSISKQSQKFCPEAIMFLQTLLMAAMDRNPGQLQDSQISHVVELKVLRPLLLIRSHVKEINPLDFLKLMDMPEDSSFFSSDSFRVSMLACVIESLRGFINVYEGFSSFPEIFLPISKLLIELAGQEYIPNALQDKIKDVSELIDKKACEHHMLRRPLQMRKQKPVPIKLLHPKIEENFVKGRDYDPDRERAERRKLKKLIKQEAKGAARELRKDNYFLFEVKEKDKARLEEERADKYGKAKAFLQEQEHAFRSGQLGKGRKRRR